MTSVCQCRGKCASVSGCMWLYAVTRWRHGQKSSPPGSRLGQIGREIWQPWPPGELNREKFDLGRGYVKQKMMILNSDLTNSVIQRVSLCMTEQSTPIIVRLLYGGAPPRRFRCERGFMRRLLVSHGARVSVARLGQGYMAQSGNTGHREAYGMAPRTRVLFALALLGRRGVSHPRASRVWCFA